tara:strand:- start:290 stop:505 length:216 start_codon:yes stop_codon:yes gene_type:complete
MAKEPALEFEGTVIDIMPGRFKVKLDNGHTVDGMLSGKMRTNNIKVILHDKVKIEMTPYDITKGRITFRYK